MDFTYISGNIISINTNGSNLGITRILIGGKDAESGYNWFIRILIWLYKLKICRLGKISVPDSVTQYKFWISASLWSEHFIFPKVSVVSLLSAGGFNAGLLQRCYIMQANFHPIIPQTRWRYDLNPSNNNELVSRASMLYGKNTPFLRLSMLYCNTDSDLQRYKSIHLSNIRITSNCTQLCTSYCVFCMTCRAERVKDEKVTGTGKKGEK